MHQVSWGDILATIALCVVTSPSCSKRGTPQGRHPAARQLIARRSGTPVKRYRIHFERKLKPGARYKLKTSGNMDTEILQDGRQDSRESTSYSYMAEVTVKALHPCGKATREVHKVLKAHRTVAGATRVVLLPGTTVLAEVVGGKKRFTVRGIPVSTGAAVLLEASAVLFDGNTNSSHDIYDPERRRAVGESWKVKGARVLAGLKQRVRSLAIWPKAGDIQGTVTLIAARRIKGMEMLEIKARVLMKNTASMLTVTKVKSGEVAYTNTFLVPADPRARAVYRASQTSQAKIEYLIYVTGRPVTMAQKTLQSLRRSVSPLP